MEELRKRALLIFNPIAGEKRSLRLMPEVIKRMTESGYICTALTTTGRGSAPLSGRRFSVSVSRCC